MPEEIGGGDVLPKPVCQHLPLAKGSVNIEPMPIKKPQVSKEEMGKNQS
jgi:hypothetical protein